MPQTCPHCGIALTGAIDAYCPECREDLSATPEEAAQKPTLGEMRQALRAPAAAFEGVQTVFFVAMLAVAGVVALFDAMRDGEWLQAGFFAFLLVLGGVGIVAYLRGPQIKTSVSGRDKTTKSSEQPK